MAIERIFHITSKEECEAALSTGEYRPRGFADDGFIHCSTLHQVTPVANRFFRDADELCLLEIDPSKLAHDVVYENLEGGSERYPHLYGPLHLEAVVTIVDLDRDADGSYSFPRPMHALAASLRSVVEQAARSLRGFTPERAAFRAAPDQWCAKEVLGHLIDSANVNHGRFVRARREPGLCHPGYDQNDWVASGGYGRLSWPELVDHWVLANRLIARVVESTPEDVFLRERREHDLDRIAWRTVPRSQGVSLAYFMDDYVNHLVHHLGQVDPKLGSRD